MTTAIAGVDSTALQFEDGTTNLRFGSEDTLTANSTGTGYNHMQGGVASDAAGPIQLSATTMRLELAGGADNTPSDGVVRVTVVYLDTTPPTS